MPRLSSSRRVHPKRSRETQAGQHVLQSSSTRRPLAGLARYDDPDLAVALAVLRRRGQHLVHGTRQGSHLSWVVDEEFIVAMRNPSSDVICERTTLDGANWAVSVPR